MFGSAILDVVIGLISIFLFLSLIGTAINEWVSGILRMRANNLEEGIRNILNDPDGKGLAKAFYDHPLISSLARGKEKPSYIPSRLFALALTDIIAPTGPEKGSKTIDQIRGSVEKIENEGLKKNILIALDQAGDNIHQGRQNIEKWFDEGMERVSGWYKRKIQWITLGYALLITIFLNVDTIAVTNALYRDSALRAGMVAAAQEIAKQPIGESSAKRTEETVKGVKTELEKIKLPIGWDIPAKPESASKTAVYDWIIRICGWIITAFAVTLGAPFWFDVLNKFINIRSAGTKPKLSGEEKKEKSA
jgi:hypothetical protein